MKSSRIACIYVLLASFILTIVLPVSRGYAQETGESVLNISSKAYILVDADSGKTLLSLNEHEQRPPASMTKLMTLLLAVEDIESGKVSPSELVTASEKAWGMGGSQIYLEIGEQMTLHDMLLAMALESANDASVAVAEHLEGSVENFVARMNRRAVELGMKDTHYVNCNGLPSEGHVSSAWDMSRLALEAVQHPKILEYTSLKEANLRDNSKLIYNTNKLLWRFDGADGLKTGWTTEAGNCLTATAQREGLRMICVVMGGEMRHSQFHDSEILLDYGFSHYGYKSFFVKNNICASLQVGKGEVNQVDLFAAEDVGISYKKDNEEDISYSIITQPYMDAPIHKGDKLGEISIFADGECRKKIDLCAADDVERGGVLRQMGKMLKSVFML